MSDLDTVIGDLRQGLASLEKARALAAQANIGADDLAALDDAYAKIPNP
jgi:hypothetical protein